MGTLTLVYTKAGGDNAVEAGLYLVDNRLYFGV